MPVLAEYQNTYKWIIRMYFDARDSDKSQGEVDEYCAAIIDAFRSDPCINQTCMFSMIQRAEVFFSPGEKDFIMVEMEVHTTDVEGEESTNIESKRDGIKDILDDTNIFIRVNEYNQKTLPKLPAADIWFDGWVLDRHFGGKI